MTETNIRPAPGGVKSFADAAEQRKKYLEQATRDGKEFRDALAEVGPVNTEGYEHHPAFAQLMTVAQMASGLSDKEAAALAVHILANAKRDAQGNILLSGVNKDGFVQEIEDNLRILQALAALTDIIFELDHPFESISAKIREAL